VSPAKAERLADWLRANGGAAPVRDILSRHAAGIRNADQLAQVLSEYEARWPGRINTTGKATIILAPDRSQDNSKDYVSYRQAAIALWQEAGTYAHDCYDELRALLYPQLPAQLPITIGLTAYGHCVGLTRTRWEYGPRITLFSPAFRRGGPYIRDIIAHELLHAWLYLADLKTDHNTDDWYDAVTRLSPLLLGHELAAKRGADRKSVRVPNPDWEPGNGTPKTLVRKVRNEDVIQHDEIARWPHSFRPPGYYLNQPAIRCPTY